jgi:serine/threonine-protein kinase
MSSDVPGERGRLGRNPYLNRVMIRETADFYGRRREAAKVFARIGASRPQSVAIVGERRIGKSSLLHHVCTPDGRARHLDAPDRYAFVFIDFQEQRDLDVAGFFDHLFGALDRALGRARPPALTPDYEGARRAILELHELGRKLILLCDEFDAVTTNARFPEEFFSFLRAIANKYDVAYVTTSREDLQKLCHADRIADSPFFNIFSNLYLAHFDPEEARALIAGPSAAAGVPLAPYTDAIVDMAGLFPFLLQMACAACFDQLAETGRLDLDRARAAFLEEAEPHFHYLCSHYDADERAVLRDLLERRTSPPSRAYLLGRLKRDGYVLERDGRDVLFSSVFEACAREGRLSSHGLTVAPDDSDEGGPAPTRYPPRAGDQVSHFRVVRLLGEGGMGMVFAAEDLQLRRMVALKVLPPDVVRDSERKRRLLQEARAASALLHPNIAVVYEAGEVDGVMFVAMEHVEGQTLRDRLRTGRVELATLVALGCQIGEALAAAHDRHVVHRDVKPENVMLTADERVKVLDFGIAKLDPGTAGSRDTATTLEADLRTRPGVFLGTVAYMSPEQAQGRPVDGRSDIFSLGSVLFEMTTGRPPFGRHADAETLNAILTRPPSLDEVASPALAAVLARALEKDREKRFQTMGALVTSLRGVTRDGSRAGWLGRVRGWLGRASAR